MSGPRLLTPLALLLLALSTHARGEEGTLSTDSPFVSSAAASSAQAATAVEFRGVLVQGGVRYFNLVDAGTRKGAWVALNEPGPQGWVVRSCEQVGDSETVTVEGGGRTLRLPLLRPRTGKAATQPAVQGGATAAQAQGPVTPVVINPTPAQQAKAQEDIMAEVRRRRLQRQQQAAQQQQTAAPQPAVPPPPPQR